MSSGWTSNSRVRRALAGAGVVAGGAVAGAIAAGYYVASAVTRPGRYTPREEYTFSPFELGIPYEDVTFPPELGDHYVRGWWLPRPETTSVVIVCTGYRAKRSDMLGISSALWRAGFNVLLFDFFGHGAQIGAPVTLGYRELNDLLGALDYALHRVRGARIGVVGFSMGAAVSIMGTARRPEIRALVADSSFATHEGEVRYAVSQTFRMPAACARLIARVADQFIYWRAGYHHRDVEPLAEVARIAPRPILFIHSSTDETIDVGDARRLFAAAGEPKELWIGAATSHCGVYFLDRQSYCARVSAFLAHALSDGSAAPPRPPASAIADRAQQPA
ncbi:MAG TPA: alpha/beta hydrolase [Ktedonobacterales bacterium]|nr:alpha/beta hydrolase [Ktedonobacterales bacterium]